MWINFFWGIGVWKNINYGEVEVTGEDTLGLTLYFTTSRDACDTECVRETEGAGGSTAFAMCYAEQRIAEQAP